MKNRYYKPLFFILLLISFTPVFSVEEKEEKKMSDYTEGMTPEEYLEMLKKSGTPEFTYTDLNDQQQNYLNQLIEIAHKKKLYEQRYWKLLLHYKDRTIRKDKSEAKGNIFFMADDGDTNPRAELEKTLQSFFQGDLRHYSYLPHPRCLFRARYSWLVKELSIDESMIPAVECKRYDQWRQTIHPSSISIVFASYYMGNPSSMFGHTFVKLNNSEYSGSYELLDYGVNYAAAMDAHETNTVIMALVGLTGGYDGYFSIFPYYLKVKEYNDIDNRDLWEYKLNFHDEEIERIVEHLWELHQTTNFDYYFFNRNCSYQILTLLEVGRPGIHLSDQFLYAVIPPDTIKVVEKAGLIESYKLRSSLAGQYKRRYDSLTRKERKIFKKVVNKRDISHLDNLSDKEKAAVLDTAMDFLMYKKNSEKKVSPDQNSFYSNLIKLRAELKVENKELPLLVESRNPLESNQSTRLFLTGGVLNKKSYFSTLQITPAVHLINDRWVGYSPYSQILFGHTEFRVFYKDKKSNPDIFLKAIRGIDILSLNPVKYNLFNKSWLTSVGIDSVDPLTISGMKRYGYFDYASGIALETHIHYLLDRITAFSMIKFRLETAPFLPYYARVSPGLFSGILMRLTDFWTVYGFWEYRYYFDGKTQTPYSFVNLESTLSFNRSLAINITSELNYITRDYGIEGGLKFYFLM